jgi:hypothetical protein
VKEDAKDGDVDVRVKIAPNDEDDLTEVLYKGNKARLAVPVEKMEDLEGLTVTKGDKSTTVHVFANHGEHVDLKQRLKEQVLNVAIDIRKNRLDIYKLELDGVNKNLAQLARDNGSPSKIAKSTEIKEGFEEKIRLLNDVYKDFETNHSQVRNFLNNENSLLGGSKSADRKAARKALQRIIVTKFKGNDQAKKLISEAIKSKNEEIDRAFVSSDVPNGKDLQLSTPISSPEDYVEGLTLSLGENDEFITPTRRLETLVMFLVKSKVDPPEFVIETAYPN